MPRKKFSSDNIAHKAETRLRNFHNKIKASSGGYSSKEVLDQAYNDCLSAAEECLAQVERRKRPYHADTIRVTKVVNQLKDRNSDVYKHYQRLHQRLPSCRVVEATDKTQQPVGVDETVPLQSPVAGGQQGNKSDVAVEHEMKASQSLAEKLMAFAVAHQLLVSGSVGVAIAALAIAATLTLVSASVLSFGALPAAIAVAGVAVGAGMVGGGLAYRFFKSTAEAVKPVDADVSQLEAAVGPETAALL